jgi:hypothetical protein
VVEVKPFGLLTALLFLLCRSPPIPFPRRIIFRDIILPGMLGR